MKNFALLVSLWMAVGIGCSNSSGPAKATVPNMSSLALTVLPHVTSTSSFSARSRMAIAATGGFTSGEETSLQGNEAFNIYRTFGDPTLDPSYPNDSWGVENIRNNLDIANALYDLMLKSTTYPTTISTSVHSTPYTVSAPAQQSLPPSVSSPYSFSNTPAGINYSTGLAGTNLGIPMVIYGAWGLVENFYMLSTQQMLDKNETTVFEGQYTSATKALRLNRASRVESGSEHFITRMELNGNTETSEFTLRMAKQNTGAFGTHLSMAGQGFSNGAGKFFVLKAANCSGAACLTGATPVTWYCISSSAAASNYVAYIRTGANSAITHASDHTGFTGDCATYASALDSVTLFYDADLSDNAVDYVSTLGM